MLKIEFYICCIPSLCKLGLRPVASISVYSAHCVVEGAAVGVGRRESGQGLRVARSDSEARNTPWRRAWWLCLCLWWGSGLHELVARWTRWRELKLYSRSDYIQLKSSCGLLSTTVLYIIGYEQVGAHSRSLGNHRRMSLCLFRVLSLSPFRIRRCSRFSTATSVFKW
jgi:hypothetical protein